MTTNTKCKSYISDIFLENLFYLKAPIHELLKDECVVKGNAVNMKLQADMKNCKVGKKNEAPHWQHLSGQDK